MSITELIVACVLMAFAFAAVGELVVLTTVANSKLTNSIDGATGGNLFISRVADDVRAASALGYPPDATTQQIISAAGGFPPNFLTVNGPQTLIIEEPALFNPSNPSMSDLAGVPLMVPAGSLGGGVPALNEPYYDVVVYQVLPDQGSQYLIQEVRFAGNPLIPNTTLRTAIPANPPHVVLKGLIGPIGPSGQPAVFVPVAGGVRINIEVETPSPNTNNINVRHIGLHSEAYLRSAKNTYAENFIVPPAS